MTTPLITIITVVYNAKSALETTILNVLEQTYPRLEYIVIDGGSDDGTVAVLTQYASKIKYWISEKDQGIYDAMNKGWAIADLNSYVVFLGAGDKIISLPTFIHEDNSVIFGNVEIGDKYLFNSKADLRLRLGNTLHHQAMLVPKRIHPDPPFSLDYKIYSDFDFNQRLLKAGNKFKKDDDFVSYAAEDGVSAQFTSKEPLKIIKNNFGLVYVVLARIYYYLQSKFKYNG